MMEFPVLAFATVAAIYDIKTRKIPNLLIIGMFGIWAFIVCVLLLIDIDRVALVLVDSGLGMLFGGGIFISVYLICRRGLGGGDVKFMAAAGLFLGLGGTLVSIFIGTVLAAIIGLILIMLKKITRKDKMPLAPFLLAGIITTIFLI